MMRLGWAGIALIALAACTPETVETPAAEESAAAPAAAALQTCEVTEAATGAMIDQLSSCTIALGDGQPTLQVSSDAMAEGEGKLRIDVTDASGASLQQIEETATGTFSYPYIEDIDGDGAADIMVPLLTGNVNTSYALWLKTADGTFKRAGELSGVSIGHTPEGLIAASGRSSAAEWETQYFRVTNGELEEVAAVVNRPEPLKDESGVDLPACEVIRILEGIDPAPFCAEGAPVPG